MTTIITNGVNALVDRHGSKAGRHPGPRRHLEIARC
jgi:hypothetical protein